jgi:hypothetical protein
MAYGLLSYVPDHNNELAALLLLEQVHAINSTYVNVVW